VLYFIITVTYSYEINTTNPPILPLLIRTPSSACGSGVGEEGNRVGGSYASGRLSEASMSGSIFMKLGRTYSGVEAEGDLGFHP
jgi:hypothetical protein